ncbi:hypothetical protein C8Q70DRAFT_1068529, partial [Cubamyces menziesii]
MRHLRAKGRASPALSASARSIPATGAQPTPATRGSRGKKLMKTSLKYLIPALQITKGVSSACPQLQSAVEALLIVLEAYKKYSEATEAIGTLLSRIQSLNEILNKSQSADNCPPSLKDSLVTLASKLQEVAGDAEKVQAKGWIVRLVKASDYAERIESWVKRLDQYIHSFLLERTIAVELAVHQGFAAVDSGLDKMNEGVAAVKEKIIELHCDVNHKLEDDALRNNLRPVIEARWDYGSSVHEKCHENTRMEVMATLCSWLRPDDPRLTKLPTPVVSAPFDRSILWLHALAGSGKSTIAMTIADWWDMDGLLGASFFCARDGDRSNINCIFRTIAYQLAIRFPAFREQLTKILKSDPDLYSSTSTRQLQRLIVEPLHAVHADTKRKATLTAHVAIVIDALDECKDDAAVSTILKSLALHIGRLSPLKFLITSRPEENIARGFLQQSLDENTHKLALNKVPGELTRRDISAFLQWRLDEIRVNFALDTSWPSPQQLKNLIDLSELLFIFASLATRYIQDDIGRDPERRLASLLDAGNEATANRGTSTSPFHILDSLYVQVLQNAVPKNVALDDAGRKDEAALRAKLKLILGAIVLAEQRLSPTTLDALLDLSAGTAKRVLPVLSAILTMPDRQDHTTPISIIHLSFPNFLIDPTRCTDQSFLVRPRIQHSHIAFRCLSIMNMTLKYNILGVASEQDCVLNSEIPDLPARLSRNIPAALEYACRYWTRHLCEAEVGEDLLTALEEFCECHLLHWLEALSLLGCVDGAVEALQSVQTCLKASILKCSYPLCDPYSTVLLQNESLRSTDVPSLLYDCERAIRAYYPIISTSAMPMYSTIAVFAPAGTPIPLAFSPDEIYVACAKENGSIQLLNAHTGAELQILNSHSNECVSCLSFSPTGKELLSCSEDGTVALWDVATGAILNTWEAHSGYVCSVAWSLNGTLAASASDDGTVGVWRMASPENMVVLQHGHWMRDVVFAQDGDLL